MKNSNFPKTVSPYVSMAYGLVQRCNASYKDFIFAPIDQVNPLRALFRPSKPTWYDKSAILGLFNTRFTVLSIGYGVNYPKYRCSHTSSVEIYPIEALQVLDRGKVSPPLGRSETVLGCGLGANPMRTEREYTRKSLHHKPRPSDYLSVLGGKYPLPGWYVPEEIVAPGAVWRAWSHLLSGSGPEGVGDPSRLIHGSHVVPLSASLSPDHFQKGA